MIEIGKYNQLKILRTTSVGLYLGDEEGESVLLPNKYCPEEYQIDDILNVFVYLDYAERKIATNLIPKIHMHEFALLQVQSVEEVGAFMDWGLEKGLLVPFSEQRQKMEKGRWYVVFMDIDSKTDRLFASNKIDKYLQNDILEIKEGDEVELIISQKTDLGYSAIINHLHKGLLYENEVFRELNIGDKIKGFVKKIREDNKIDLTLNPPDNKKSTETNAELILRLLKENDGYLALNDKSLPAEINLQFGISKKAFKKSIGLLYKERKIVITDDGLKLITGLQGDESSK